MWSASERVSRWDGVGERMSGMMVGGWEANLDWAERRWVSGLNSSVADDGREE
jgi:hypothetical protein